MRTENGIPRPFQPSNLAQEVKDLRRDVAALKARRNFVSVERIVEGGTINENVGRQLTETVQKDIVIDGGNLGEGALDGQRMVGAIIETNADANRGVKIDDTGLRGYDADGNRYMKADEVGLEMTGSISTKGKTAEATPRDIAVRLTTMTRNIVGGATVSNPAVVFDTGIAFGNAPGFYSPDGELLVANGRLDGVSDRGSLKLSQSKTSVNAATIAIGTTGILGATDAVTIEAKQITAGSAPDLLNPTGANVNLLGNVKVNGKTIEPRAWTNIPMPSGRSALDGNKPAVRIDSTGEYLEFTGGIVLTTSVGTAGTLLTIPDATLRPATFKNLLIPTSTGPAGLTINPQGQMYLPLTSMPANTWVDFSQLRFAINGPR